MPDIRDLIRAGADWPPRPHRDRIEAQETYALLARNRRHELIQEFSLDLLRGVDGVQEDVVPFPSARVAARTLSAFLFGEDPTYTHPDDTVAKRINDLAAGSNLASTLLESAYTQVVEGEVFLRPTWDTDLDPDHAIVTGVAGRRVIPRFRYGRLIDAAVVTTWVDEKGGAITGSGRQHRRLVEFYVPSGIERRLYVGSADRLGGEAPLESFAETADLDDAVDTDIPEPLLVHVPLGRDTESPHGVSLFDGLEGMILAMHRLYSQEQHDAEMARRRIAVSEEFVKRDAGGNPVVDRRLDLFVLTEAAAGAVGAERKPIEAIEFSDDLVMRERLQGRFREFLIACGIAPDTLDATETGGAISGTSRRLAQALTIQTVGAVGRYWQHALAHTLRLAMLVETTHLGANLPAAALEVAPTVTLADGMIDDESELARIIVDLDSAEAISPEQKIRRVHPEWGDEEVADELAAITGASPPAPTFTGGTSFGA